MDLVSFVLTQITIRSDILGHKAHMIAISCCLYGCWARKVYLSRSSWLQRCESSFYTSADYLAPMINWLCSFWDSLWCCEFVYVFNYPLPSDAQSICSDNLPDTESHTERLHLLLCRLLVAAITGHTLCNIAVADIYCIHVYVHVDRGLFVIRVCLSWWYQLHWCI